MNKLTTLILIILFSFLGSIQAVAEEEMATETSSSDSGNEVVINEAKSSVTIGFSGESGKKNDAITPPIKTYPEKPIGECLPSTGENIGLGLSVIGLLIVILLFRKKTKEISGNKKNKRGRI